MSSKHFLKLLKTQINTFVAIFQDDSNVLFKDAQNVLIHPGEYGEYRERCFRLLLRSILSRDTETTDGFIISSSNDNISTQCDVIVKNAFSMPLVDNGIANFFPVEDVYCVVEIKSNLAKSELKAALRKLAEVKKIGDDRKCFKSTMHSSFLHHEPIPTFLVCNKLNFSNLASIDFEDIYRGIDRKYWHNAILSIENGLFIYNAPISELPETLQKVYLHGDLLKIEDSIDIQYPQIIVKLPGKPESFNCSTKLIETKSTDIYAHIYLFLAFVKQAIDESFRYYFDSLEYLELGEKQRKIIKAESRDA